MTGQTIDSRPGLSPRPGETAVLGARPRTSFAISWTGGKDSALALWTLRRGLLEPDALITTVTETYERISMHGVRRELLARQAEVLGIPLVEVVIPPSCVDEIYDARMAQTFAAAPLSAVDAVAFGDLFLEDVRAYREGRLAAAGKRGLFPLWGHDTAALARDFLDAGFEGRRSSASTRARSTPPLRGGATTSGCPPTCRPALTPAARTASSTPSSPRARSSPSRSPSRAARSSSATDSSSAT